MLWPEEVCSAAALSQGDIKVQILQDPELTPSRASLLKQSYDVDTTISEEDHCCPPPALGYEPPQIHILRDFFILMAFFNVPTGLPSLQDALSSVFKFISNGKLNRVLCLKETSL